MAIALYQPDIPQNVGSLIRLCACLEMPLHIIEPCGFVFDDNRIRRAAMDYIDHAQLTRHSSWEAFEAWRMAQRPAPRLVLLTTKATANHTGFSFRPGDILLFGRESAGVPPRIAEAADARLRIDINPATRSLNLALSAAIAAGEMRRQLSQGSTAC